MVSSEEIIERSMYMSLLSTALANKLTLDPDDYLPINPNNQAKYQHDRSKLDKFIYIFGIGNNQSRGQKEVPRISLELQGYYPSTFGVESYSIENVGDKSKVINHDYSPRDVIIDVHLVANTQEDMRLLHSIMYSSLPSRGYIKPFLGNKEEYFSSKLNPDNNLFIEVGNFYDKPGLQHGLLEKVYSYTIYDGVLSGTVVDEVPNLTDISVILTPEVSDAVVSINVGESNDTPIT